MWEEFSDKEDLIRRQDMIESILFATADGDKADWIIGVIKSVPSAQKTGHWINRSLNILYPEWERYICSSCGKCSNNYNYCPNCGAYMRGEEE